MQIKQHGITIGLNRFDNEFILVLKAVGTLTDEDYKIISPFIETSLKNIKDASIKVLVDATEFEGWELEAAWDDFKLGLKYGTKFTKMAIYGHQKWLEYGTKISSWFMPGEYRFFKNYEEAVKWLRN